MQDKRAYIDYQGKREYSPRGLSLEEVVRWRANKEKEYGLDKELGEYPVKEVIELLKAQAEKAIREEAKLEQMAESQI